MREHSFSATVDTGDFFLVLRADSVAVLNLGATANLVCFRWPERRNRFLGRHSLQRVSVYQLEATFRFGDGRVGEVRYAAGITVGIVGNKGTFAASVLDADSPALLRDAAADALGGQLNFPREFFGFKFPAGFNSPSCGQVGAPYPECGRFWEGPIEEGA